MSGGSMVECVGELDLVDPVGVSEGVSEYSSG